jgi:thiol:disulfide interchange protein DsbD
MSVLRPAFLAGLVALLVAGPVAAQASYPVAWKFTVRKITAKTYEVHMTATLLDGWHLYSQGTQPDLNRAATQFTFEKSPWVIPEARIREVGKLFIAPDTAFDAHQRYYQHSVDFVDKVLVTGKVPATLKGSVRFAPAVDHYPVIPATKDFSVDLK